MAILGNLLNTLEHDLRALALAVVGGAALVYMAPALLPLTVFVPLLALCLLRAPGRTLLAAMLLSAAWTTFLAQQHMTRRLPASADGSIRWLHGHIAGVPQPGHFRTRFLFANASTNADAPGLLRLSWYNDAPALATGDCYDLKAKLSAPHGSANPGNFDYEQWLWRKGIDATGYIKAARRCRPDRSSLIQSWRQAVVHKIGAVLGEHPMRGIIEALSVGVTQRISQAQWDVFRNTGTTHIVAISGWHIGLVAGWLLFVTRLVLLRLPGQLPGRLPVLALSAVVGVTGAWLYALLAGLGLPTLRAVIMLATGLLALLYARRISFSRILALAAILVVLWRPMAVLSPGFWLSFGAVAWIVYLVRMRPRGKLAFVLWLQLGICVGLAPLTLYIFNQASLVAPLVNLIMLPLAGIYVPILLLAILTTVIAPAIGGPWLQYCATVLGAGWGLLEQVAAWPLATLMQPVPGLLAVLLALLGIALLFAPRATPARWLGLILLLPLAVGWRPAATAIPAGGYRLTVLDVGQGLAVVVRTRGHVLVYDAGPKYRTGFNAGSYIVVPFLHHARIRALDMLMISHADNDHIGGAGVIMQQMPVRERVGAGSDTPCHAGQVWRWDGVELRVLHPRQTQLQTSTNNGSCVLRIAGPGGVTLLPGDIEAPAEQALVARAGQRLAAAIVVAPHHGSATSSSAAFVAATRPQYALVSSGWHNQWNFPRADVVQRYAQAGARVYDTATAGALQADVFPGQPLRIQRWRVQHRRLWQLP